MRPGDLYGEKYVTSINGTPVRLQLENQTVRSTMKERQILANFGSAPRRIPTK